MFKKDVFEFEWAYVGREKKKKLVSLAHVILVLASSFVLKTKIITHT